MKIHFGNFILINSHNFLESSSLTHPSLPQESVLIQQVRSLFFLKKIYRWLTPFLPSYFFSALSPSKGENWLLWRKHSSMPILVYNVYLHLVTLGCGSCNTKLIFLEFFFPGDFKILFLNSKANTWWVLFFVVLCGIFLLCGPINHFDWRKKGKRWKKIFRIKNKCISI